RVRAQRGELKRNTLPRNRAHLDVLIDGVGSRVGGVFRDRYREKAGEHGARREFRVKDDLARPTSKVEGLSRADAADSIILRGGSDPSVTAGHAIRWSADQHVLGRKEQGRKPVAAPRRSFRRTDRKRLRESRQLWHEAPSGPTPGVEIASAALLGRDLVEGFAERRCLQPTTRRTRLRGDATRRTP